MLDGVVLLKAWSSSRLFWSSLVVVAFLVVHLRTFRFGKDYTTTIEGVGQARDFARLEREVDPTPTGTSPRGPTPAPP